MRVPTALILGLLLCAGAWAQTPRYCGKAGRNELEANIELAEVFLEDHPVAPGQFDPSGANALERALLDISICPEEAPAALAALDGEPPGPTPSFSSEFVRAVHVLSAAQRARYRSLAAIAAATLRASPAASRPVVRSAAQALLPWAPGGKPVGPNPSLKVRCRLAAQPMHDLVYDWNHQDGALWFSYSASFLWMMSLCPEQFYRGFADDPGALKSWLHEVDIASFWDAGGDSRARLEREREQDIRFLRAHPSARYDAVRLAILHRFEQICVTVVDEPERACHPIPVR